MNNPRRSVASAFHRVSVNGLVAQNGAAIKESTPITVTGCSKPVHKAKAKKAKGSGKKGKQ